jgi:hypothetical protein
MSEPAKDEAELMERVAEALYDNYDLDLPMSFTLAAIRAAGWAVVPVEVTFNMESEGSVAMVKFGYLPSPGEAAEIYAAMLAAAPGMEP